MAQPPVIRRMDFLHPRVQKDFANVQSALTAAFVTGRTKYAFRVFETYRTLERQQWAFDAGTSKARPWSSAHNVGCAADFVPYGTGRDGQPAGWFWPSAEDPEWDKLREIAHASTSGRCYSLIAWDRPHVEHEHWNKVLRWSMK